MAKFQAKEKNDPIANALAAVTATTSAPKADEASIAAHAAHLAKQPPVDNDHVAEGAQKFTPAEITANKTPAPAAAPATPERPKLKGQQWRLKPKGNLHNSWDFTAQRGTIMEDCLVPTYWADMAQQFRPFDEVSVICEDGTWRADFQIISADKQWAKVYLLKHYDFTKAYINMPKTQEDEYETPWTVTGKYAVIRKDMHGQPPLKDGFETKLEALTWLDGHLKTLNNG